VQAYGGDKTFFRFDGTHNSRRPAAFYNLVVAFLKSTLLGTAEHLVMADENAVRAQQLSHLSPSPGALSLAVIKLHGYLAFRPRALIYDREV
jgi:hypothetical protein